MKTELELVKKYRVVKGVYTVVGILTHVQLGRPPEANGGISSMYSHLELTKDVGLLGEPYTVKVYGPWDQIEPVTD